jgi:hypothetical protein
MNGKMKVIDLFAGSRSVGKVCEDLGFQYFSVDNNPKLKQIDLIKNVLDLDISDFPFRPDVVWASPPCTLFSNANSTALQQHFNKVYRSSREFVYFAKSEEAKNAIEIVKKTLALIQELKPKYFYIENPAQGRMKHLQELRHIYRVKIAYYDYGFNYWKPTNIFTNNTNWKPRKMTAKRDLKNHITMGGNNYQNAYERSKVPYELIHEILINSK